MIHAKGVNGEVSFDGRQIVIERRGAMARATVGKGRKVIPLSAISAVQWKPAGLVRGFVAFTVPGGNEARSRAGRQSVDAARDENAVLFGRTQSRAFEELRIAVEAAIAHGTTPASAASSVADELGKLADLVDRGALTPEQFEAERARLLGA